MKSQIIYLFITIRIEYGDICLGAVKEGFLRGCRRYIGLDGCFLPGPNKGQLLCVVGMDADSGIYPAAYAVLGIGSWSCWWLICEGSDSSSRIHTLCLAHSLEL